MRLATFSTDDADRHIGVVSGSEIVDLSAVSGGPASLQDLLSRPDWASTMGGLVRGAPRVPLSAATLHAPVPRPPKYLAIGLNARDHRKDINVRWLLREPRLVRIALGYLLAHPRPENPYFFAKANSSVTGPHDPIVIPPHAMQVDWEGELAVIVGRPLLDASVEGARAAIAGYTVANDVSVRDWQTDNPTSASMAKGYPSHGPLGPWLATPDEFDTATAQMSTYVNGELRQRGRIADLIHAPAEILSMLSKFCLLEPGDIVACGTFSGTGWPTGQFLQSGDTVRVEIDGIGHLENPVIAS